MTRSIAGLVLAGGLARRMGGGQKALLPLAGRPLLAHVLDRLSAQVDTIAINANADHDLYAPFDRPVIADTLTGHLGPLAGVLSGLRWAKGTGHTHIVSVAGDTPFFPDTLVNGLSAALTDATPIALAASPDPERGLSRHPTFGLWPTALADDLEAALQGGLRKVVAWTDVHGCATVPFSATPYDPFFNVNAPADMAKAEKLAADHDL